MPYRSRTSSALANAARPRERDRDLLAVGLVFWAASVADVVLTLARHEPFGAIATLAVIAVVVLPCIAFRFRT